jgi:predicted HTH domain antitoxin
MHRLSITRRDLTAALRLARRRRKVPPDWTVVLDHDVADALSHATGVDPSVLTAMTLARYDGVALKLNHARREVTRTQLWGRGAGSRYCPQCLAETAGRWSLAWRLSWSFSCVKHLCLLADICPTCQGTPRTRHHWRATPQPGSCDQPADPALRGRALIRCGHDLTATATTRLSPPHPAIRAQQLIQDAINSGTAAFGIYAAEPAPAAAMLSDLTALASRVINYVPSEHLCQFLPAEGVTLYERAKALPLNRYRPGRADSRSGTMAPANAVIAATSLTIAMHILGNEETAAATTALRDVFAGGRAPGFFPHRPSTAPLGRHTTSALTTVHLSAIGGWLPPGDQLRYRVATPKPQPPRKYSSRARCVPTMLWPWWSLRMSSTATVHTRTVRPALACAVLTVGSTMSPSGAAELLGRPSDPGYVTRTLTVLHRDAAWPAIASALIRLADHLDTCGSPIDYERRRRLAYHDLLPTDEWQRLCHQAGASPGLDARARSARCYLFERISGTPAELAPPAYAITDPFQRTTATEFPVHLTPTLQTHLDNAGREFLTRMGVGDEPITWQPPTELGAGLNLPGHDPDRIDVQALHDLVRRRERISWSRLAELLGTSIDAVRYVLEVSPALPASFPLTRAQARKPSLVVPRATIGAEELANLYTEQRLSLSEIARRIHLPRRHVTLLVREYRIPLRPRYARRFTLDADQLHEQYTIQRRSLRDIAVEYGVNDTTVLHWLTVYGIRRRPPGGAGHDQAIRVLRDRDSVPARLRPVMTGTRAWKRLHAFATLARHPNYDTAAAALGCHRTTLRDYVLRLEGELGAVLLHRARAARPLRLTKAGKDLLRAIEARPVPPRP